ncbi:YmaF family protein [Lentibacillus juripiscarius]|uniref:YmaF family protein n=1 Tax=Lentibacillus juripiscarius TaxID=257446 RepID=A0ABW5V6R4_9BACI
MYYDFSQYPYAWNPATNPNSMPYPYSFYPDEAPRHEQSKQKAKTGHTHAHYGSTTCDDKHNHLHPGVTSTPIETDEGHVHIIYGNTTFDDGHIHYYEAYTSPPISLGNGYHTHYAEITTTENDGHTHVIKGYTAASKR